ncbi:extracellular solute-binding protein [Clostridium sp. MD294]|uniref:ABC transporter substrate-binding protein n=1 Tax=Clostridium sp. MD294 TaxID=97138 RepID=UPI0002CC01A4|nr:extracellular solute-binding protein [Clostridium sp. MD294]NDO45628.1 extracellular solute-binding protein [Clostridium sp. MD294]USF30717.1 Multiple sugar-binding protein [Clostridium sp. MD294]
MKSRMKTVGSILLIGAMFSTALLSGCSTETASGKTVIEIVQYKPEAVKAFEALEEKFNATHDNIELVIDSPNDAMTILKTRFVREDYPEIIGIGGDINYSNFLDAEMLMDISDFEGLSNIKDSYLKINKQLEFIPLDGIYAVPYMANAAGVLYNKDIFNENGWKIPETLDEFYKLCEDIQKKGMQPLYFGFRDTWTTLAPWNAIAVDVADAEICSQVNAGLATFSEGYRPVAEITKSLLKYAQPDPVAYSYNDACTAFARGESVMYVIGSYAVPQIKSVNPDINIDSFVFPASNNKEENVLNSGNDLQWSVMAGNEDKKEAIYEVLNFLYEDENIQTYLDDQSAVPCKKGDFELPSMLDGMKPYIENDKMADYQDHHYPAEMAVDAMIQTYLVDNSENATDTFLTKFDADWARYNRDLIAKVQKFYSEHPEKLTEGGE